MSHSHTTPAPDRPWYEPPPWRPQGNGLAIAGFVTSLVGLLSCGLIAPVGLVLSAIAARRPPRGFAIAGIVLGLLGSLWLLILAGLGGLALGAVAVQYGSVGVAVEVVADTINIELAIEEHHARHGTLPASLDELQSLDPDARTDPWGRPYHLDPASARPRLLSDGPDGLPGTPDDLNEDLDLDLNP